MAKKQEKKLSMAEMIAEMHSKGSEQQMPNTDRIVRLRALDAPTLLREGKIPDILTPLVVKMVYQELSDKELRDFMAQQKSSVEEALRMAEAVDFIVEKSIADGTKVKDLTIAEKRWIFRSALGPAELLVTFRYDEESDVEPVAEVKDVREATE